MRNVQSAGTCVCGKGSFPTRKAARKALRTTFPEGGRQVWQCPHSGYWHFGIPRGDERLPVGEQS